LTCKEWLGNGNANGEDLMFLAKDDSMVKAACNDFFPEWTQRSKIERSGARYVISMQQCNMRNIFASSWGDNDETGQTYCGDCQRKLKTLCMKCDSWNPPAKDNWGGIATATFELPNTPNSAGFKASPTKFIDSGWGGFVNYKACVIHYEVGDLISHNISEMPKFHPPSLRGCPQSVGNINCGNLAVVCGYIVRASDNCTSPNKNNLVGCVSVPPLASEIYHASMIPTIVPRVATEEEISLSALIGQYNSKFDQPVVVLITGRGANLGSIMPLRYKYNGDDTVYDDKPQCSPFPNLDNKIRYCAYIPPDMPNKVCVCIEGNCENKKYLGCTSRPTPKQSNLAILADYQESNSVGIMKTPGVRPIFVRTDPVDGALLITDAQGKDGYINPLDGNAYLMQQGARTMNQVNALPFTYKKLTLPSQELIIQDTQINFEGNGYVDDESEVYGIKFGARIAETINDDPKTISILTPETRQDKCFATTVVQQSSLPPIPIPAGMRDRSLCCPNGSISGLPNATGLPCCPTDGSVAPPLCQPTNINNGCLSCSPSIAQPCKVNINNDNLLNDADIIMNNEEAVKAMCSGQYMWPTNSESIADSICLYNRSSWNWGSESDKLCAAITTDCNAHAIPSITTGYATWQQTTVGNTDEGECKQQYGLVNRVDYNVAPGGGATPQQRAEAEAKLNALKEIFAPTGLNIPEAEINTISNNYNVIITKTERKPIRKCMAGGVATIKNSCVFANGCPAITQPADFTGNVTWPAAPTINLSTADSHIKINTQLDLVETTQNCMVEGDNGQMQAVDKKAKRACVSVYELPSKNVTVTKTGVSQKRFGGTPKLLYRYWSGAIQGGCIK
jgi:hypothetical protein